MFQSSFHIIGRAVHGIVILNFTFSFTDRDDSCRCKSRGGGSWSECGLGKCNPCKERQVHCGANLRVKHCISDTFKCDSNNDCGNWNDEPDSCEFSPALQTTLSISPVKSTIESTYSTSGHFISASHYRNRCAPCTLSTGSSIGINTKKPIQSKLKMLFVPI